MNHWNQKGLPHKGWTCVGVEDRRDDGQSEDETDYASCEMCGNEKVRYVHIMNHPDVYNDIEVGCMCAEKMTEDYVGPRRKETELKNKASRKTRWLKRKWKQSANGNFYLNIDGNHILVFRRKNGRWGYKLNTEFGENSFNSMDAAKLELFEKFYNESQT